MADMGNQGSGLKDDVAGVRTDFANLRKELREMEARLIRRMISCMAVSAAVIVGATYILGG